MRTFKQLQQIASVGGMIGVMLKDDAQDTGNGWCLPQANCSFFGGHIGGLGIPGADYTLNYTGNNAPFNHGGYLQQNCLYSTTETAEQYLYGVKAMTVQSPSVQPVPAVGVGSDFMGIAGHVGPRFGNGACGGNPGEQTLQGFAQNKLKYPFTLAGITFDKQVSGQKTYDFNVDGLAHIGLFPDMIADMKQVGVYNEELQPLFSSAQAYVNMWAAVYQLFPPTVSMSGVPATAKFGSKFTVTTSNNGTTTSVPTITAGPSNVCSINGAVVTMNTGTGTCTVTAMWVADSNYAAATRTATVTGVLIPQEAIFLVPPPQSAAYWQSFQISAASKTLSVVPELTLSGPCTSGGSSSGNTNQFPPYFQTTFTINMSSIGTGVCSMTLTFRGDGVSFGSVTLIGTTTKTLVQLSHHLLGVPNSAPYNSSFSVSAQANGGPTSTIAVSGPCTISGTSVSTTTATTSASVTMTSATGTCSITANWPSDDNFSSATLTQTTAATLAQPTVTFTGAPATAPYGSTFSVQATRGVQEPTISTVSATFSATGACSISGSTVTMTSGRGNCLLTATWAADSYYSAATLTQTTAATTAQPTVTFTNAPATAPYGSTFGVLATSTDVSQTLSVTAAGACSVSGFRVTMTSGTGTCLLTANFAADSNYSSATATQTTAAQKVPLTVSANNAVITFGQMIPNFTATYRGFVNNENQSVLSGIPSLTTTATPFSAPTTYTIAAALGTLASANYSFPTFNNGTLTITATATVPPSGSACNGAYQGGTFTGNISVTPNQICEIDGGVVNGSITSTGGVVILLGGTTVNGHVNISGTATGSSGKVALQVCGATITSNLMIQNDSSAITLGGTSCGATSVGGNLQVQSDSGAVSITSLSVTGNLTVQGDTGTVLLSGNTVGKDLQVQNNTDATANATQVLNNHVSLDLVCSGNTSITGQGNTAKSKQGQCATF
jgi:hypothetical protein